MEWNIEYEDNLTVHILICYTFVNRTVYQFQTRSQASMVLLYGVKRGEN